MEYRTETEGNCIRLIPTGDLKTTEAKGFEMMMLKELNLGHDIIVDFSEVEYICSSGLRALLAAQQTVDSSDGLKLVIKNVCDEVMNVMQTTGFDNLLTIE